MAKHRERHQVLVMADKIVALLAKSGLGVAEQCIAINMAKAIVTITVPKFVDPEGV